MTMTSQSPPSKQVPSRIEAKNELTTKAARTIIETELTKRVAKTERLRQMRLERDAAAAQAAALEPKKPAKKSSKKSAAAASKQTSA